MVRLRPDALAALFCAALLAGCGGEIARIEGMPQTRDTSAEAWPRLLDVPAPPVGLQVERGAVVLAALDRTRADVLTRAARPGPDRVARGELGDRVVRIRRQASTDAQGIDEAGLAARAERLARARTVPVVGLPASELTARAQRVAAARETVPGGIDADDLRVRSLRIAAARSLGADGTGAGDLQARSQRVSAARAVGVGGIGAEELQARARRIAAARGAPVSTIDRDALTARGERIAARTRIDDASLPLRPRIAARPPASPASVPRPKPVTPPKGRDAPVISDDFRKRAEEARRRARERAEGGETR